MVFCYRSPNGLTHTPSKVGILSILQGLSWIWLPWWRHFSPYYFLPSVLHSICCPLFCLDFLEVSSSLTLDLLLDSSWMYVLSPQLDGSSTRAWATLNISDSPTMPCKCLTCRRCPVSTGTHWDVCNETVGNESGISGISMVLSLSQLWHGTGEENWPSGYKEGGRGGGKYTEKNLINMLRYNTVLP